MRPLGMLSICLITLALQGKALAQVYETRDAEGNPEFTDAPASENAREIDLQQTNVADAPAPDPEDDDAQAGEEPAAVESDQAPVPQDDVVIERDGYDDGLYDDAEYVDGADERALRREEAVRRADPDAPREVGDAETQMPREVGDYEAQMPREVGDSEAQMPHEVGDRAIEAHRR
jgi:hypothetical protein